MDNTIRIFDLQDGGKEVNNISLGSFESWQIDFALEGNLLYACGNNGTISVINPESGDVQNETRVSDQFHMSLKGSKSELTFIFLEINAYE